MVAPLIPYLPVIGQAIVDIVTVGVGLCGLGIICDDPNEYAAPGNVADTGIANDYNDYVQEEKENCRDPDDRCTWLKKNRHRYSRARYKATEKAWNCRRSRQNR